MEKAPEVGSTRPRLARGRLVEGSVGLFESQIRQAICPLEVLRSNRQGQREQFYNGRALSARTGVWTA